MPPAPGLGPDSLSQGRNLSEGFAEIRALVPLAEPAGPAAHDRTCSNILLAIRQAAPDRLAQVTLGTILLKPRAHENLMCEPMSVGIQESGGEANVLALR